VPLLLAAGAPSTRGTRTVASWRLALPFIADKSNRNPYFALIASKIRSEVILQYLKESDLMPEQIACLKYPAGLDIGSETPKEIALSILTEIIQRRHQSPASSGQRIAQDNVAISNPRPRPKRACNYQWRKMLHWKHMIQSVARWSKLLAHISPASTPERLVTSARQAASAPSIKNRRTTFKPNLLAHDRSGDHFVLNEDMVFYGIAAEVLFLKYPSFATPMRLRRTFRVTRHSPRTNYIEEKLCR
jgi:XdhC Rossmann domain